MNPEIEAAWRALVATEQEVYVARRRMMAAVPGGDRVPVFAEALHDPTLRGAALRLLPALSLEERQALFPDLLEQATVGHSDIGAVREALMSLDPDWLEERLGPALPGLLDSEDYETYRRLAELLEQTGSAHLQALVERAGESSDPDVREVAEDFGDR